MLASLTSAAFKVSMNKKREREREECQLNYHPSFSPGLRGVTLREGEEKLHPGWRKDRAACGRPSCFGVGEAGYARYAWAS